jgi:hypothetical protein
MMLLSSSKAFITTTEQENDLAEAIDKYKKPFTTTAQVSV